MAFLTQKTNLHNKYDLTVFGSVFEQNHLINFILDYAKGLPVINVINVHVFQN